VATSLVVGRNQTAVLWGTAFLRAHAHLHPNEVLHWEAMRHWKRKGAVIYDMGGGGEYKARYGAVLEPFLHAHISRHRVMRFGRETVRRVVGVRQGLVGRLERRRMPPEGHTEPIRTTGG
jgi:hypothetical protein